MPHARPPFLALLLPLSAAATLATPTLAAPARPRPAATAQSAFLGLWELDLARMPATYGAPPKRVTYRFDDTGSGSWRTTVEITAPDNSIRRMAAQYRRDGTAAPGEGDTSEADSVAVLAPAANVLVMSLAKNKALGSVRTYILSPDGEAMTEAAADVDAQGVPFVRSFHFRRIR